MAAKKKARRTTLRSSKGTKLYAVRRADGTFKDIQTYKRAHAADLRQVSKAEAAKKPGPKKKSAKKTAAKKAGKKKGLIARLKSAIRKGTAKGRKLKFSLPLPEPKE
jgi:hypothetical protein